MSIKFLRLLSYPACAVLSTYQCSNTDYRSVDHGPSKVVPTSTYRHSPEVFSAAVVEATKVALQHMTKHGVPGFSLTVRVNGNKVMSTHDGFADIETFSVMTDKSVARIGSISKTVTALMCLSLHDQGVIDLNLPITSYLEKYGLSVKYQGKPVDITFLHLLSHTAGIRHYKEAASSDMESEEFYSNKPYSSTRDALDIFIHDELLSEPGKQFHYTTFGYTLLGFVLEEVMNKKFETIVKAFSNCYGLKSLQTDTNSDIVANRCKYYCKKDSVLHNSPSVDNSLKFPGGGMLCNSVDLALLGDMLLYSFQSNNGTFCSSENFAKMFQVHETSFHWDKNGIPNAYGLGLSIGIKIFVDGINTPARLFNFGHTGGAVGVTSCLLAFPSVDNIYDGKEARGVVVALIVNLENCPGIRDLTEDIGRIFYERLMEYEKELEDEYTTFLL